MDQSSICTTTYYTKTVWEAAEWSHRGDYMYERHGVKPAWADEAVTDPERVVLQPDPSSKSGRGVRIIGYSPTARGLVTVILLDNDGVTYGVNGWRSNSTDQRRYREGTS
jgi:hypothetical protein